MRLLSSLNQAFDVNRQVHCVITMVENFLSQNMPEFLEFLDLFVKLFPCRTILQMLEKVFDNIRPHIALAKRCR